MLTIVCFLWKDPRYRYGTIYGPEHVNRLYRMVGCQLAMPHEFVCVTDIPQSLEAGIRIVPLWPDHRDMGGTWTRVKLFAPEMRELLGPRLVLMDLDLVITASIDPLLNRPDEFVTTRSRNPASRYNTGFFLLTAGTRSQVWERFSPAAARASEKAPGMWEQGWISQVLGPDEAVWTEADGVYQYGAHCARALNGGLPRNARLVSFCGPHDPSLPQCQAKSPWITEHWR